MFKFNTDTYDRIDQYGNHYNAAEEAAAIIGNVKSIYDDAMAFGYMLKGRDLESIDPDYLPMFALNVHDFLELDADKIRQNTCVYLSDWAIIAGLIYFISDLSDDDFLSEVA